MPQKQTLHQPRNPSMNTLTILLLLSFLHVGESFHHPRTRRLPRDFQRQPSRRRPSLRQHVRQERISKKNQNEYVIAIPSYNNERFNVQIKANTTLRVQSLHTPYTKEWTMPVNTDWTNIRMQYLKPTGIKIFVPTKKHLQVPVQNTYTNTPAIMNEKQRPQPILPSAIKGWDNPTGELLEEYSNDRLNVRVVDEHFVEDYFKLPDAISGFVDNRGTFQHY